MLRLQLSVATLLAFCLAPFAAPQLAQVPAAQSQVFVFQTEQRAWWENFLRTARVVKVKGIPRGVASPQRMTLSDGTVTHDAAFKSIDEFRRGLTPMQAGVEVDLKDCYKFEIAAYELDKILELNMIPPTVPRNVNGRKGSMQFWVEHAQMELDRIQKKTFPPNSDAWNAQMFTVRLFDGLIYNFDRNLGNLLITSDWKIWMIDHSRSFKTTSFIFNQKDIVKISRDSWGKMQKLDYPTLKERLSDYLTDMEIRAVLKRRDALAVHINKLVAQRGETVFY